MPADANRRPIIIGSSAIVLGASVAASFFILRFRANYDTLYQLPAGFGPLIENLVENGRYGVFNSDGGYWAYASKMPLVPVVYGALWRATRSVDTTLIVKNLAACSVILFVLLRYAREFGVRRRAFVLAVVLFFCVPFNALTMYNLKYEEALLSFMVPAAVACTIMGGRRAIVAASILLGLIYLTKSSTLLICVWLAFAIGIDRTRQAGWLRFLPALSVLLVAILWGGFNLQMTRHFAIAGTASSNNGWNLYKGNNEMFSLYYPERHLDELSVAFRREAPVFNDEWEAHRYYSTKALDFIQNNPKQFLLNTMAKIYVLTLRIQDFDFNRNRLVKILLHDASMIVNRLMLLAATILSALWIARAKSFEEPRFRHAGVVFLGTIVSCSAPYIVGFVYQRHVVPLFLSSILILMLSAASVTGRTLAARRT